MALKKSATLVEQELVELRAWVLAHQGELAARDYDRPGLGGTTPPSPGRARGGANPVQAVGGMLAGHAAARDAVRGRLRGAVGRASSDTSEAAPSSCAQRLAYRFVGDAATSGTPRLPNGLDRRRRPVPARRSSPCLVVQGSTVHHGRRALAEPWSGRRGCSPVATSLSAYKARLRAHSGQAPSVW